MLLMLNNTKNDLTSIGLSEKQITVYVCLIKLGTATVSVIAKEAKVNRSSTYVIIDSLRKRGLVELVVGHKCQQFVAATPDAILKIAEDAVKDRTLALDSVKKIIPELRAYHKETRYKPTVKVYEGVEGLKNTYHDIFSSEAKDLKTYANPGTIFKIFPNFLEEHNIPRIKKGIKMRAINPANKESVARWRTLPKNIPDQISLIPEKEYKFPCDMAIYGNRVALVDPVKKFGIIIEHKEIAEMFKNSFNLAWKEAQRLHERIKK